MTNHYGTMFGGKVADLMDRAAFLASTRFSNQAMVTASMELLDFFVAVKSGNIVELLAQVVYTGRTSITIKVDLYSEDPLRKTRAHASQGYFHLVSVDNKGKPIPVPSLIITTVEEKTEWEYARFLLVQRKNRATQKQSSIKN
jgi:acyl-CoA hydrolase